MNLSHFKTRWHLGRQARKNVNKHVPWSPIQIPAGPGIDMLLATYLCN
jgi:hypothetical protein